MVEIGTLGEYNFAHDTRFSFYYYESEIPDYHEYTIRFRYGYDGLFRISKLYVPTYRKWILFCRILL